MHCKRIGIAGAGLFGRVLAFYLIEAGWQVSLFDRDDREGLESCGMAGAGMITPLAELEASEWLIARLGERSLALWPALVAALAEPVFFQRAGSLVVAHRADFGELARFAARVEAKLGRQLPLLSGAEITALEPELSGRFARGLYFAEEGQIDGQALFRALAGYLDRRVVRWQTRCEVTDLAPGSLVAGGESFAFDWVVDCRGLGARADLPNLRGVRGELFRVRAPEVALTRPVRLMHPRYPLYIVPRPDHHYLIGATAIESDDRGPATVRSALELLGAAYSLHSGFAEARILGSSVNCRPALPDNLPKVLFQPGLVRVNGLYRHGYLASPALAEEVLTLLTTGPERTSYPDLLVTD